MQEIHKSRKLSNVLYDIRGPVLAEAKRLESEGHEVLKLNVGNPAPFGFSAPERMMAEMAGNIQHAQGYSDSRGIAEAREAVAGYCGRKGIRGVGIDDVYIGNGVSELIVMAMQGLIDSGDELLIPSPDYPLWTAAVSLAGGNALHYRCDEGSGWYPDIEDIRSKVTTRTRGIVVINPNNPTGSVYPADVLQKIIEVARENGLIIFADEIYDKILYDGCTHYSLAALADDLFFITFNGLSKAYRAAGFRAGWMVVSGNTGAAKDYLEGLEILSNMRLCSNVPSQFAIPAALKEDRSIRELTAPGGRLREQRDIAYGMFTSIPGISCVKPAGALYLFPKIDISRFDIVDDEVFVLDFLREKKILLVHGRGFNWGAPDHFRVVFLPEKSVLQKAAEALQDFLHVYRQGSRTA